MRFSQLPIVTKTVVLVLFFGILGGLYALVRWLVYDVMPASWAPYLAAVVVGSLVIMLIVGLRIDSARKKRGSDGAVGRAEDGLD